MGALRRRPRRRGGADRASPVAGGLARGDGAVGPVRRAARVGPRAARVPRSRRRARDGGAAHRVATGRRGRRAPGGARSSRPGRRLAGSHRSASSSRSPPPGAIVAATFVSMPLVVLAAEAGFRGLDRALRAGRRRARGLARLHPAACRAPDGLAAAGRRRRARVGARARRVRRDDHLRREPAGPDTDRAVGGVPAAADRPGRRRSRCRSCSSSCRSPCWSRCGNGSWERADGSACIRAGPSR